MLHRKQYAVGYLSQGGACIPPGGGCLFLRISCGVAILADQCDPLGMLEARQIALQEKSTGTWSLGRRV